MSAQREGSLIVLYLTDGARRTAERIAAAVADAEVLRFDRESLPAQWARARALVFIMASGIVVRSIAPLLMGKDTDPAVVVMNESGEHVVSLTGGHEAGGNDLCRELARVLGATAVITTATDVNGLVSIDEFAKKHGMLIENRELLAATSARHIQAGTLTVFCDDGLPALPDGMTRTEDAAHADVLMTDRLIEHARALVVRPRKLVLGVGLNSDTPAAEVESFIRAALIENGLAFSSVRTVATHAKKKSEPGLRELCRAHGFVLRGYSTEELNRVEGVAESAAARKALGVVAVAEPAALLCSRATELLLHKVKSENVTLAVAASRTQLLSVVGTGPGGLSHMTPEALSVLRQCDAIIGFKTYLNLIEPLLDGKEVVSSAMTEEVKRVRLAVEEAMKGRHVAVVSGGDPGVYAMAGLVFEVVDSMDAPVEVEVIPGISALNACAARLGAPLMHDFAVISLSDRLTPWEQIERRLEAAAQADFVIVLYNPKSKGRKTQIDRAREIVLKHRGGQTPVGIVRAAMRETEDVVITNLEDMPDAEIDMQSTVIIGNSNTVVRRDRMVTPRGYERKYAV